MLVEKVIWTTLPAGFDAEGRLRLTVHVAPRLTTDDGDPSERTLDEFGAFAAWPDTLAGLEFEVQVTDQLGGAVDGHGAQRTDDGADADLWKIVFPHDTLVRPHAFQDHAKRNVHVFPVREVLSVIETTYGALAASGPDLPAVDDPKGPLAVFGALDGLTDRLRDSESFYDELGRAREKAEGSEVEDGVVVHENLASSGLPWQQQAAQAAIGEAARFYYRPGNRNPDLPEGYVEPPPVVPRYDFHEVVALLADHPTLLRRLGLLIDLVVDLPEPVGALPDHGLVRAVPHGTLPEDPPTAPWTSYDLDDEWFGARPKDDFRMERGLVNLTPEFWDLFQVDVDGAALQAVGFGGTLGAMLDPALSGPDTPSETGAPALRSAGLALARQGRGEQLLDDLVDRRDKNWAIEAGSADQVVFDAEDLVRGYRVDVWDDATSEGARWHPLHARVTEHHVEGLDGPIVVHDEGYLKATAASSERQDHPTPSDDLYLHETIAAWEGWSLAGPRPGKRIVEPGEGDDGTSVARFDPTIGQVMAVRSEVAVEPGTLPRLRLGHTYRLRMRTVDLAGNSRPFSPEDYHVESDWLASDEEMYLRFEPIPSPTVLRRHLDTEGESLEHLVIRSDLATTAAAYAASPGVKEALEKAGVEHAYAADSQRHLAPPKGSVAMAEQDARLEGAFGGTPTAMASALRLALREEGTFLDPKIVDTATGQKTINQTTILTHPSGLDLPTEDERGAGLGPDNPGAYAHHPDGEVVLPYLPDPWAVGVMLIGYDRAGTELFSHSEPFPGGWPSLTPFRLRLSEGPIGIGFSDDAIQVTLPQAEVVHAHLSSVFPGDRLEYLAIWHWTPEPERTALKQAMVEGRHWMLTPFRRLTFTHAVQRPLAVPDMSKVVAARGLGRTYAEFRGPILNHAKSTGRLDVLASWTEDVDLLTDDEPKMRATDDAVAHSAHAFGFELEPGEDAAEVARPGVGRVARHEFGDTKHRRVIYHSVATTRFREYLVRPIADDPSAIQRVEEAMIDEATPKPMLVHHVPSSARPAMPDPLYVLPTFRWDIDNESPVRTHVRRGKAVRVWLRRPWFSSGDDEQLGVVLQPGIRLPGRWGRADLVLEVERSRLASRARPIVSHRALRPSPPPVSPSGPPRSRASAADRPRLAASPAWFGARAIDLEPVVAFPDGVLPTEAEIEEMLKPYVTQWGSDPVWASRLPLLPPTVADFPRHVSYGTGLTLEELPAAARVVVAGHEVHYDTGRRLWYCDIEIENGDAYYPFVRLALARYQPYSVPNAHLSRVVMTDFVQLAPDRTARVAPTRSGMAVTVEGYAGRNAVPDALPPFLAEFQPPEAGPRPNTEMRVSIEQRPKGIPGDLGWDRIGSETTLSADATGWFVRWSGSIAAGQPADGVDRRLLITEVETHLRDLMPDDPDHSIGPRDFVRERVVYADAFEL